MHFNLSGFSLTAFLLPPPSVPRCQGVGMANKGPSYGLSRQVQDKIDSKYDPELEQILVEWINRQCGSGVGKPEPGKLGFQAWLKDGCVSTNLHASGHCMYRQYKMMCFIRVYGPLYWKITFPFHVLTPHIIFISPDSEPAGEQPVCWRQTREEDPKLIHGLQTNGADFPVPESSRGIRRQQDGHVPNRGSLGRSANCKRCKHFTEEDKTQLGSQDVTLCLQ